MQVTFEGNILNLEGRQLHEGDKLTNFTVSRNDLSPFTFSDTSGVRIILSVPSVDTPVCDVEIVTFNKRASEVPGVSLYTISMDLPFAQARYCGVLDIENVITLSDYKDHSFAKATGTYIKELGLLTRAAFVVNAQGELIYAEYIKEITDLPDFDAILEAARGA